MPVILPRFIKPVFALLAGAVAAAACSVDDAAPPAAVACSGLNCDLDSASDSPKPQEVYPSSTDTPDAMPLATPVKAMCGTGSCVPDDPRACENHVDGSPSDPQGDAGAADAGAIDVGNADAGADAGPRSSEIDGNYERPSPARDAGPSQFACHIELAGDSVARSCMAAGTQQANGTCTSSSDCAPGLGCVGSARAGRCLPFCCSLDPSACGKGSYCAERPLRDDALGEREGPLVPVCERADNCSLAETGNCVGAECVCRNNTVCTPVGLDGTTACLPVGTGTAGQPCRGSDDGAPSRCASGFYCSPATNTCVKMCDLDEVDDCGAGLCQATPVLPPGWGICVGAAPSNMSN